MGLEGVIGKTRFFSQNVTIIGATLHADLDLFKIKENDIFGGVGIGFSYLNKSIKGRNTMVSHRKLPTIIHGEVGLKYPFRYNNKNLEFLLLARFSHTSALFDKNDKGINVWGINFGVGW